MQDNISDSVLIRLHHDRIGSKASLVQAFAVSPLNNLTGAPIKRVTNTATPDGGSVHGFAP